jgi:hypothetical protein
LVQLLSAYFFGSGNWRFFSCFFFSVVVHKVPMLFRIGGIGT